MKHPTQALLLCLSPLLLAVNPVEAQVQRRTNCQALKLRAVSSLPDGTERSYSFEGSCRMAEGLKGNLKIVAEVPVRAEAIWHPKSRELRESVAVDGPRYAGYVVFTLTCDTDPIAGRALCERMDYSNTTGWEGFDVYREREKPITAGLAAAEEVAVLTSAGRDSTRPGARPAAARVAAAVLQGMARQDSNASAGDSAWVELPAEGDLRIPLESGMILATLEIEEAFRWALLGEDGATIMRLYPAGSRALRNGLGDIVVDWGGGVHQAGRQRPPRLPGRPRP